MSKKLCKQVKDRMQKDSPKKYKALVKDGHYFCKNCGLVAHKASKLCKPEEI